MNEQEVFQFLDKSLVQYFEKPIPKPKKLIWKKIYRKKIEKTDEDLVSLSLNPEKILVRSQYFLQGFEGAMSDCFARKKVFLKLLEAANLLPAGYKLIILDAWRSVDLQRDLFNKFKQELKKKYPNKSEHELIKLVKEFVSLPSEDPDKPSPHNTGGSVDVTVANDKGQMLEMGTKFDDTSIKSYTRYYEKLADNEFDQETYIILKNRRLLYNVMTEVGFTNYPQEWWHYDYGNQLWAWFSNSSRAFYGKIKPSFRWELTGN